MKARGAFAVTALLAAITGLPAVAADAAVAGATPPQSAMPGLTVVDTHLRACVDCHIAYPDRGVDARLSVRLAEWTRGEIAPRLLELAQASAPRGALVKGRHPESSDALDDVPNACLDCHADDARRAPPFARLIHLVHLAGGAQNHFVTVFQAECTLCHKLDTDTGQWSVPSGPEQ